MSDWIDLHALWQVVLVGLIFGAGLPALFAVGLRALSAPGHRRTLSVADGQAQTAATGADQVYGGNPAGLVVAIVCFAVILAAVGYGVYLIVAGG
jgi:hypothetical protein